MSSAPPPIDPLRDQLCRVCDEPAAGFHFGAFTCEGCKSFFGRTCNNQATAIQECKNNHMCTIDKKNRTSCKACRLRKCLMVGMSKSGSRYGRRSNWFKIHCLMQQQQQKNRCQTKTRNEPTVALPGAAMTTQSAPLVTSPTKSNLDTLLSSLSPVSTDSTLTKFPSPPPPPPISITSPSPALLAQLLLSSGMMMPLSPLLLMPPSPFNLSENSVQDQKDVPGSSVTPSASQPIDLSLPKKRRRSTLDNNQNVIDEPVQDIAIAGANKDEDKESNQVLNLSLQ